MKNEKLRSRCACYFMFFETAQIANFVNQTRRWCFQNRSKSVYFCNFPDKNGIFFDIFVCFLNFFRRFLRSPAYLIDQIGNLGCFKEHKIARAAVQQFFIFHFYFLIFLPPACLWLNFPAFCLTCFWIFSLGFAVFTFRFSLSSLTVGEGVLPGLMEWKKVRTKYKTQSRYKRKLPT